ncbi:MAG: peptide chain release factor N(5)-glutamine methyltransferase [Oscillospiraceae bacterium]|nr:peptide chain release factor N(5)-glutamine methyltransferase [Oscillospiraceae bacterium]
MKTFGDLFKTLETSAPSSFEGGEIFRFVTGISAHSADMCAPLAPEMRGQAERLLKARADGYPLQYLLGEWEFYGLPFKVGPGVLIPRQDTETLADSALDLLKASKTAQPEVLDLCSGSGCLAIVIAHHFPAAKVSAVERSALAFPYLTENIALNGVSVAAVECDLRDYIHPAPLDLIVCNPPYIPRSDFQNLQIEVTHEPIDALDGGQDGLDYFRVIARRYKDQLAPGGHLLFEVGDEQAQAVSAILTSFNYEEITLRPDLTGKVRVVGGRPACK